MQYVTPLQLAQAPGALELAQVASTGYETVVDAELMELTLRGGDRSAYAADAIAAADVALARINELIDEAGSLIDGYIGKRYALPLNLVTIPTILTTWARAIVRYKLHANRDGDERTDPVVRDYKDALRFLQQVASGQFSLGIDDPEDAPSTPGDVQFDNGAKVFGRKVMP